MSQRVPAHRTPRWSSCSARSRQACWREMRDSRVRASPTRPIRNCRLLEDQGAWRGSDSSRPTWVSSGWSVGSLRVRCQLPDADLFQEGCLGLITAVERFDHARGYRFSTYALYLDPRLHRRGGRQASGSDEPAN